MEDDHLPTLFEILNRFSKTPLDLWSFYVFLKEQYGGVEYLEFWLDCAAHTALCKEVVKEMQVKTNSQVSNVFSDQTPQLRNSNGQTNDDLNSSPNSSVLYNMLQQDQLENNRDSLLSDERTRNKRDTVSRLSEILDDLRMPEYPDATATSPTRHAKLRQDVQNEYDTVLDDGIDYVYEQRRRRAGTMATDSTVEDFGLGISQPQPQPPTQPPPTALTPPTSPPTNNNHNNILETDTPLFHQSSRMPSTAAAGGRQLTPNANKTMIKESAQQIINTYLTPKAPKEIELPSDANGWSLSQDIRNASLTSSGLTNPKLFDMATTYVFEALEREALPAFLAYRGVSNVQPVSASLRLIAGLVALFGGFWLSFVFVLLDWEPKSHRCYVIIPFGIGFYLTLTSLYHIDPILAYLGLCEKDGGGVVAVQEKVVRKMQSKRGTFVLVTIVLCAAAMSVLFILVPGYRL